MQMYICFIRIIIFIDSIKLANTMITSMKYNIKGVISFRNILTHIKNQVCTVHSSNSDNWKVRMNERLITKVGYTEPTKLI